MPLRRQSAFAKASRNTAPGREGRVGGLEVEAAYDYGFSEDVAVDGCDDVGAGGVRPEGEHRVQRKKLE
jgi:hypothetical protein